MRLAAAAAAMLAAAAAAAQEVEETPDAFPPGPGQEEVFYLCTACHGSAIVKAQGMSRERWDESVQIMIDRHGMVEPEPAERALIVDYLAREFPPRRREYRNPFLKN